MKKKKTIAEEWLQYYNEVQWFNWKLEDEALEQKGWLEREFKFRQWAKV